MIDPKIKYLEWQKNEPLSDMCVDAENAFRFDGTQLTEADGDEYWEMMLICGENSVAIRKEEA